jgi:hypothetical protein
MIFVQYFFIPITADAKAMDLFQESSHVPKNMLGKPTDQNKEKRRKFLHREILIIKFFFQGTHKTLLEFVNFTKKIKLIKRLLTKYFSEIFKFLSSGITNKNLYLHLFYIKMINLN